MLKVVPALFHFYASIAYSILRAFKGQQHFAFDTKVYLWIQTFEIIMHCLQIKMSVFIP